LRSSAVARRPGFHYHISDPEKAVIVIENVYNAINQISQTTVRNVVGRFSLDQLLSDTASINLQIKNVIDGHTEPWGTQVTAVEIKADLMQAH
jgi:regulator of protease activity HflC (stomatin/prohibitin superfamily)